MREVVVGLSTGWKVGVVDVIVVDEGLHLPTTSSTAQRHWHPESAHSSSMMWTVSWLRM
jgi:hypothetical protein